VARDYPLAAIAASRANGTQLVLTRHVAVSVTQEPPLTLRNVARVIAVSRAVSDRLRAQRIFDSSKITVIHNGIDIDRIAKGSEGIADRGAGRETSRRHDRTHRAHQGSKGISCAPLRSYVSAGKMSISSLSEKINHTKARIGRALKS